MSAERPETLAEAVTEVDRLIGVWSAQPVHAKLLAPAIVVTLKRIRGGMVAPVEWAEVNVADLIEERDTARAERDRARATAVSLEQVAAFAGLEAAGLRVGAGSCRDGSPTIPPASGAA